MSEYSLLDRILHNLALNFQAVRHASFDIERSMVRINSENIAQQPHVFVTGLARAGTSILLRILYQSGDFACQTYRDMPFILSPQLWRMLSGGWRKPGEARERAHADGMLVDFDSVEAFEEVFWLTFAGDLYVHDDHLSAHHVDEDVASKFYDYISIVIAAEKLQGRRRYLSKNNNNLLRLPGLMQAFPAAHIIIPFRTPLQHAHSLLRQHQNFSKTQSADPFIAKYMRWLGHFEFGLDYRPFTFGETDHARYMKGEDTDQLQHWLKHWTRIYQGVLETAPANAIFWDYDAFCADPKGKITLLAERLALAPDVLGAAVANIQQLQGYSNPDALPLAVMEQADQTHAALIIRAQKIFG